MESPASPVLDLMKQPVVLIIARGGRLSENTKHQALGVAKRLDVRILVAYVDTMPFLHEGDFRTQSFHEDLQHDMETTDSDVFSTTSNS